MTQRKNRTGGAKDSLQGRGTNPVKSSKDVPLWRPSEARTQQVGITRFTEVVSARWQYQSASAQHAVALWACAHSDRAVYPVT